MPAQIFSLGDILVEVMRKGLDQPLNRPADFSGPYPSGASAIFIDAAARLGGSCGYIGKVGGIDSDTVVRADDFGACVINRLRDDNVDVAHVQALPGYTTGIAFVMYRGDGSRRFLFHLPQSAAAQLDAADVPAEAVRAAKFVHITGSALSINTKVRSACYRAIELCKAGGGRVSFDPNVRPELLGGMDKLREIVRPVLDACDVLLPSGAEATLLSGDDDEDTACRTLLQRGIGLVALKRGERGSKIFAGSAEIEAPSISVAEVDPTGAGDCFGGAFIVGLLEGWELAKIARFANVVGGLSVTRVGPMEGAPTRAEALAQM